ncbi:mRNA-capping enzyme isoform X1 [Manduca sexta]|uniref:mRNA-capping enzyme isoform X1 n=1 Tax=Manduca sexta TaxID=7130 RepID=UPI00188FDD9D|nr:mRNA-capping enzyme isoform X1 [Manduca sexta]
MQIKMFGRNSLFDLLPYKAGSAPNVQKNNSEIKEIWDIPALLAKVPKLGAVIDLTNTARYYDPAELVKAGVIHKKILMPGRIIPPENKVQEFFQAVDEFLGKNRDHLLGVHCTHGLNRTGYMVCRFMRDRLGIPAKDAIKKFERARGYQIERENYIADLLGKEPPPPDVGKETEIKAVATRRDYAYVSPLQNDDDYYYTQSHDRYNRNNRSKETRRRGDRRPEKSSDRERSRQRKEAYDYRYDY